MRVFTTGTGLVRPAKRLTTSFVAPEFVLAPPDAEEKPIQIKEPRRWFWQGKKEENLKET